jgi:hypothetical protein
MGDEEEARAAAQGAVTADLAAGLTNDFVTKTHVDEVMTWLGANMGAIDALGEPMRKAIAKACKLHVESLPVEGMNGKGFVEAWSAARDAHRNGVANGTR